MADRRIRKARFSSRDLCVLVDAVMEKKTAGDVGDWEATLPARPGGGMSGSTCRTQSQCGFRNPQDLGGSPQEGARPEEKHQARREHSGQHVVSEEQHIPECQLSPIPLCNNIDMPLIRGIKDENHETPSESLSTSEEWEEVVVGDEGTTVEAWRPSMVGAPSQLDAVTDLNGPAFKRRLLEHGVRVEQSLAFMHTTLEDGMIRLDQRLSSLQSAIEQIATPMTAAVETSLMQAIGTAGASLMNAHSVAMEALGTKLKEAVVAGFDSLGEHLHGTMTEGFKNLIEAQCSTLTQMITYCEEMPSTSSLSEVQAVDTHVSNSSVPPHISN
ncbi:uncharacterized protein LOC144501651 isoform X2 [Mustelus asterias]